jgi:N-glycosylase/DNA lyase
MKTPEELLELLSALPDFVIDFDGHVPGDHALRLAERAGIKVPKEAWDAVWRRSGIPQGGSHD